MTGRPIPLGVLEEPGRPVEYVFDVPGEGRVGFTFIALCTLPALRRVCGGSDAWLQESFPRTQMRCSSADGVTMLPLGVQVISAARYCVSLCIDEQQRRNRAFTPAPAGRRPLDEVIAWLRQWGPAWRRACRMHRQQREYEANHS